MKPSRREEPMMQGEERQKKAWGRQESTLAAAQGCTMLGEERQKKA